MLRDDAAAGLPRWVELPAAALLLLTVSPLLMLLAAAVRLSSPGPAFFRQKRVGRGGRNFTLVKLRTMRQATPGAAGSYVTASGDPRITRLGRFLRATKLDELPQLLNVLRGELSFVGPRPEVPSLVDLGDPRWQRVLEARPGLTDPVTLRLRNEEELLARAPDRESFYRRSLQPWKLAGYIEYLERRSPFSDLWLLGQTLTAIALPRTAAPPDIAEIEAGYRPL
jgi:lipopolysaccharide/colanic/teichoic acid biosynthesis glycosyltransferase